MLYYIYMFYFIYVIYYIYIYIIRTMHIVFLITHCVWFFLPINDTQRFSGRIFRDSPRKKDGELLTLDEASRTMTTCDDWGSQK